MVEQPGPRAEAPGRALGRVFVTGAEGFVGRHLVAELQAHGIAVRGGTRNPGVTPRDDLAYADLLDREAVRRALRGIDTVVHLAGRVHVMRDTSADPLEEFRRANVEGTRILLEESIAAGARGFVFASSVKAMGDGSPAVLTEASPAAPVDPYGLSKLEAEAVVAEARDRIHTSVLRFPLIYGPGMKGNMLRLFQLVDRGIPLPFRSVRNRRSMLFVLNATGAIRALMEARHRSGELFLCSDHDDVSTPDLIEAVAAALGRPARLLPFPLGPARIAARVGDAVARHRAFPLTTVALDRLLGSLYVDSTKLSLQAGFRPEYGLREGLARTARWYREAR